jgi:hypothetical protein
MPSYTVSICRWPASSWVFLRSRSSSPRQHDSSPFSILRGSTRKPDSRKALHSGNGFRHPVPGSDLHGGEVRVRQAAETYNQAFNRLTEKAVDVRSEARDAFRVYRSTYDIAGHYQREVLPLREIISDEMKLRFSSMQVDVFALLTEARQRIAALRAAIEAKRDFWLAQSELKTAVNGGGSRSESPRQPRASATAQAGGGGH